MDMGVLDLAMEALDMDLEVTEVDSILENVRLMKTSNQMSLKNKSIKNCPRKFLKTKLKQMKKHTTLLLLVQLKQSPIAMEETLEVKVDLAMEVMDMEDLEMVDLEVTEVDIILERDLLMLNPIALEVMVDLAMEDLAMEVMDMVDLAKVDLEVTEGGTILEKDLLMLNSTTLIETLAKLFSSIDKMDMDLAVKDLTKVDLSEPNHHILSRTQIIKLFFKSHYVPTA